MPTAPTAKDESPQHSLRIVQLSGSFEAFGVVMDYLSRAEPYAKFDLGNFSRSIRLQLRRRHHLAAMSGEQMVGYVGWLLTSRSIAEKWTRDGGVLKQATEGPDAAALTVVAVTDKAAIPLLMRRARQLNPGIRVYFKREYPADVRHARKSSVLNFGSAEPSGESDG